MELRDSASLDDCITDIQNMNNEKPRGKQIPASPVTLYWILTDVLSLSKSLSD